ncbi:MAG: UvrD-helicase domain-containing protein, partial [Myxococcota bacterium]
MPRREDLITVTQALLTHGERWLDALWAEMTDVHSEIPVTHDVYLKLWALSEPRCPAKFVLFDEAQDANPLMLGVLRLWEWRDGAQIVAVGDRYQQIYSWRGAVNAMKRLRTRHTVRLTQSFRYGDEIAAVARAVLERLRGVDFPIKGTGPGSVVVTDPEARPEGLPDAILTRTNAAAVSEVVSLVARGVAVGVAGGVFELIRLLEGVEALRAGKRARCPELAGYNNWHEVVQESMEEGGQDLRVLVRLVDDYDVSFLLTTLRHIEATEDPEVTVSTA